ncbi:ATP-binding protein [Aquincola tertiaricarbonis]|uniref:ATP-binding protein n=1 Tax=Aquincola tertiaricarbonis TaxID=391953 RepID=UPI0006151580|nr:winged helix-turn-helix domain-containing protein [Aquincola tertiaricarbonis]
MPDETALHFGPFRLLPSRRQLFEGDRPVAIGGRAFDLLVALVDCAGDVVPAKVLLERVWGRSVVDDSSLRVHIATLRKLLGDGRDGLRYISNVPLRGYCFVAPVSPVQAGEAGASTDAPAAAAGALPPDPERPGRLPTPVRLLGREASIDEIAQRLGACRCLSIVGPGGIGKTAVAVAAAHRLREAFEHGAVFLDLTPLGHAALVPTLLASALGIAVDALRPIDALARHLQGRQLLVVLDNCEHLIDATADLAQQLLARAPRLRLLATSREALRVDGELLHRLPPLPAPPAAVPLSLDQARSYPAVQLFAERASDGLGGFVLQEADAEVVGEICRRLDGIPLAIELAAASVQVLGIHELASHLGDRLSMLVHGRRTALPRHQTLRATLDWSFDLLGPAEQSVLMRLSVFRGWFTLEAADAVCTDGAGRLDVIDCVGQLVGKSMLSADVGGEVAYYRLLESTRAYAQERLAARGEWAATAARHALHQQSVYLEAEAGREQRSPGQWIALHGRGIDDLRAAIAWAFGAGGAGVVGVTLVATSAPLWFALSLIGEYRQLAEQALAQARQQPVDAIRLMQLHEAHGHALWHTRGSGPAMHEAFSQALALAERNAAVAYQLRAVWGLWLICNTVGDYAGSRRLAERFGDIAGPAPPPDTALTHDRMMALGLHFHGEQARAMQHARRVLEHPITVNHVARNSGFQFDQRVSALTVLARILWVRGLPEQALAHARLAVQEAQQIRHALSLCYAIANGAAPVAFWAGDREAARHYTGLLLDCATDAALDFWLAFGHGYRLALLLTDADAAARMPAPPLQHPAAGQLLRETLCTIDATLADDDLLARARLGGGSWCAPELMRVKALRLLQQGEGACQAEARQLLREAIELAREQQALSWELRCTMALARCWQQEGQARWGLPLLTGVLERFTEGHDTADLRAAGQLLYSLEAG